MKYFLYYCYYSLYKWAERRDKDTAKFITVSFITVTLYSNVAILFALVTIFTGVDVHSLLTSDKSKYVRLAWLALWGVGIWIALRLFNVHKKAFSEEMKKKYEIAGCKSWWVITYYAGSYILMAVSAWFAGKSLGLH